MMKRKFAVLFVLLVAMSLFASFGNLASKKKTPALTHLIMVRHAEKNNETDTTTLAPAGVDRANRLAQMLVNTDLAAIYTTPFVRMDQTAEPTARQKNLAIQHYTPHEISEIDRIIETYLGKTILIVGHGNTIPGILNHYTGSSIENLSGYNDVFVLTILNAKLNTNSFLHFYY